MTTVQRIVTLLGCFLTISIVGTLHADSGTQPSKQVYSPHARAIAIELARCPCWTHFRSDEVEFRAGITRLYVELAKYSKTEIRQGIEAYILSHETDLFGDIDARAKVFALLRVVFKVPAQGIAVADAGHIETYGNPVHDGVVDIFWPFSLNHGSELELTGVALTDYSGSTLNPLVEFDTFAEKYPLRYSQK